VSYYNKYNLLNANKTDRFSENTFLFSFEHQLLGGNIIIHEYSIYLQNIRNKDSELYNNIPLSEYIINNKDIYTSPDQLLAYACFSYKHRIGIHKRIWEQLKSLFGTYNNITGRFDIKRIMHPKIIIMIGLLNKNIISYLMLPLLLIMMYFSMKNKGTSTKLLWWVFIKTIGWKWLFKLWKTWNVYSEKETFEIYFPDEQHPIREILWIK
jgi:hypothetical protein